jgi:anaerobic ribonucleoside-triphosphate reductase activating protein
MNILATQYTLATKSFEIYVAGCKGQPHCKNCHNPESWDFNQGNRWSEEYYLSIIKPKIVEFSNMIRSIMIFGGEPLDQKHSELLSMLYDLKEFNKDIWLFTRYNLEDIPKEIVDCCDYIKCGRYEENNTTDNHMEYGIKLATSNQHIYKQGVDY